jgi:hypothetical protein
MVPLQFKGDFRSSRIPGVGSWLFTDVSGRPNESNIKGSSSPRPA